MLRHTLATLAYRAGKALRGAPPEFSGFAPAPGSRTAGQILAHMGDLMDWGTSIAMLAQTWKEPPARPWDADVKRFFHALAAIDAELAHTGVTGYRDVPSKAPVTPDTVFRIASMTKSFTAMAILKLRDEGKLSLDDPAEKYVPEMKALVYPTSDSPRITIRHLLSHAEGFPEDNPWGDQQLADTDEQLSAMIKAGIPFSNAPGLAYEYSNFGFAILGRLVANVSRGRTDPAGATAAYTRYITENILAPLAMTSTTLEPTSVPAERLAHGYRWEDGQWKNEPLLANGSFGSMGGMLTTLSDLGKYVGAFLAAWPPRDGAEGAPIRRSSLREMQQVSRPAPAAVSRSGSGVQLNAGGYGYGL